MIKLLGLQELENEIRATEKALEASRGKLGESQALKKAREKVNQAESIFNELSSRQKSLEWQAEDLKAKLDRANEQLYSGRVKNPKELSNLQHEAQLLSSNISKTDEETLEVIEKAETAEDALSQQKETLRQVEAEWQAEQEELKNAIPGYQARITELRQKRDELIGAIDEQYIRIYERIKLQRGQAVARVLQGACEGCHISLSSAQLQRSRSTNIEKCANCGRILFSE